MVAAIAVVVAFEFLVELIYTFLCKIFYAHFLIHFFNSHFFPFWFHFRFYDFFSLSTFSVCLKFFFWFFSYFVVIIQMLTSIYIHMSIKLFRRVYLEFDWNLYAQLMTILFMSYTHIHTYMHISSSKIALRSCCSMCWRSNRWRCLTYFWNKEQKVFQKKYFLGIFLNLIHQVHSSRY